MRDTRILLIFTVIGVSLLLALSVLAHTPSVSAFQQPLSTPLPLDPASAVKRIAPLINDEQQLAFEIPLSASDPVLDGSFEATTSNQSNPYWEEYSDLFDSPLCNAAACGYNYAKSGGWYTWFGGAGDGLAESGYVIQTVTIPVGSAQLVFYLWMGANFGADGQFAVGQFTAIMDSEMLFTVTQDDAPVYDSYKKVKVNISQYADGQPHVLKFAESDTAPGGNINFFLDDVSIRLPAGVKSHAQPTQAFTNDPITVTAQVTDTAGQLLADQLLIFTDQHFSAYLSGVNIVPPVSTSGNGVINFIYDPEDESLEFSGSVTNLTGIVQAAYLKWAKAGQNGAMIAPLFFTETADGATLEGDISLPAGGRDALLNGGLYAIIETSTCHVGEVRGQLIDQNLTSILNGNQVVPPVETSNGGGRIRFQFSPANRLLKYTGRVSNLLGNVSTTKIYSGPAGSNGSELASLSFQNFPNGALFNGALVIPQWAVNSLLSEGMYISVATNLLPAGEVRGQIKVGARGLTGALNENFYNFSLDTPGSLRVYTFADTYFDQVQVDFILRKLFLPLIRN